MQTSVQATFKSAQIIALGGFPAQSLAPSALPVSELERLIKNHKTRLTNFIRKNLRRDEYVEDVLQQTCLAAFRGWNGFRGDSKPETWLFGIAVNVVRNFRCRDSSFRVMTEDIEDFHNDLPADCYYEPEVMAIREESMSELRQLIAELPEKMRVVVAMVLLEGNSYQEAADALELPIGTVRSRLSRARDYLRERVAQVA